MSTQNKSVDLDRVNERTSVFILGGGQGSRLYPLTKARAKPAVPVAGKFRLIDLPVSNCLHSRLDRIYILTQFNSDSLHRHISQTYRFDVFSKGFVQVLAAQQTPENQNWYQGTADAVRHALRRFVRRKPEHVLILSGDHLYRMDYRQLLRTHVKTDADATISVLPVSRNHCKEYGILQADDQGKIVSFFEKPSDSELLDRLRVPPVVFDNQGVSSSGRDYIASMGIYVFRTDALIEALNEHQGSDFGKDIIPALLEEKRVFAHFFDGYWEDIGTIRSFYHANLALTEELPQFNFYDETGLVYTRPRFLPGAKINDANIHSSLICDGSIIMGAVVKNSIIGLRGIVAENAQVYNTVMMGADYYDSPGVAQEDIPPGAPALGIGPRSIVQGAIVDKNARIGSDVRITNPSRIMEADG
ncbi:MAG: glucose-1-phosphate adenylyltransferase, partial [Candidatus Omnitrophota bacterium]